MDEIIYLEPDEEITSIIDKIKKTEKQSLGLVVPRAATLLQSVVNLRLLLREAQSLNKKIAIVTTDRIGQNLAAQIGLPVFNSIEEQKPKFVPPPPRPEPSEVIEIDESVKQKPEKDPEGVQVHHFQQQEKPVVWQRKQTPIFRAKPADFIKSAESKANTGEHFKKEKDSKMLKKVLWPIAAVLLILILIATYLILPRAEAIVYVPSENLQKQFPVVVSSSAKTASYEGNFVLPGQLIESSAQKKDKFTATGEKNTGTKASATITIYNQFDSNSHSFPIGTQLANSSKTFLTTQAVTVGGAGVQGGNILPGSVKVNIEAQNPGPDYNVKAGRFTILGLSAVQQAGIYGQSSDDLTNGTSKQVQVVSQSDYDNAKNKLIGDLQTTVNQDFQTKTKNLKVLDKSIVTPDPQVTSSVNVNQEAQEFEVTVSYKEQAMVFDFAQMKDFLVKVLQNQVSSDKMVAIAKDEDISLTVNKTNYDSGELDLDTNVLAKVATKISADKIKTTIAGKSQQQAEDFIKTQTGVSKVEINFKPSWWIKKMPILQRNISVKIEYQTD